VERILTFQPQRNLESESRWHVQSVVEETLELLTAVTAAQRAPLGHGNSMAGNTAVGGATRQFHQVAMKLVPNALQACF